MKINDTQKLVIVVAVVGLILIALLVGQKPKEPVDISVVDTGDKPVIPEKKEDVYVGYGWSIKDDSSAAVLEAVGLMNNGLKGKSPEYVILYSTVGYDSGVILDELKKLLPGTKLYGGTSTLGVVTGDGLHIGSTGSLAILGIYSDKIDFGVGAVDMDQYNSPREAGVEVAKRAIKDAGRENEKPQLMFIMSAPGQEEFILEGIEEVIGKGIPVIGGSAGDNDLTGKWKEFADYKTYSNGIALTAIYTDLKVGWNYEAGYSKSENKGVITKAEGRKIYEIDGKPAAEVYNEWTDGLVTEELEGNGGQVLSKATFYPLARIIHQGNDVYYLSINPFTIEMPSKAMTIFTRVEPGYEVLLMHGTWEMLLNRAQTTPRKALLSKNIQSGEGYFGIYIHCAGTMLAIPEDERGKVPILISRELGDTPFIGAITLGEQGPLGEHNHHGNLINSMTVFAPNN